MGYEKGRLSRDAIVQAAGTVVLEKGYGTPSTAELAHAAGVSTGKLTHHFSTKAALFEAVFEELMGRFRAGPLACLCDGSVDPLWRIHNFFDSMLSFYCTQSTLIGCPIGHTAGDADGVSAPMRQTAYALLFETESCFARAFREQGVSRARARALATLCVSAWQGAVVVARAGGGVEHIRKVFRALETESAGAAAAQG